MTEARLVGRQLGRALVRAWRIPAVLAGAPLLLGGVSALYSPAHAACLAGVGLIAAAAAPRRRRTP